MNTGIKILAGITAATLVGVGIGVLIAPNSGAESRKKLKKGTNDVANKLLELVRSNGESIRDKAHEVVEDVKATYNQAKGYAHSELNHLEEKVKKA